MFIGVTFEAIAARSMSTHFWTMQNGVALAGAVAQFGVVGAIVVPAGSEARPGVSSTGPPRCEMPPTLPVRGSSVSSALAIARPRRESGNSIAMKSFFKRS